LSNENESKVGSKVQGRAKEVAKHVEDSKCDLDRWSGPCRNPKEDEDDLLRYEVEKDKDMDEEKDEEREDELDAGEDDKPLELRGKCQQETNQDARK